MSLPSLNDSTLRTTAALSAAFPARADLSPLQPRGLTATKLGIVLPVGTASFETWLVESPCVVFDPATQQWVMVYTGYSTISGAAGNASVGLATSLDAVNWTRSGTPVIQGTGVSGDPDQYGTTAPVLWIENGTYYLFYVGLDASGYEAGTKRMMLATASSINGPWTRRGVIIAPSPAGTGWRSIAIYHPNIVKSNQKYFLFFNANGTVSGVQGERIGYATASSPLGPWMVDDTNSPLVGLGAPGAWDSQLAGDPSVYRVGDTWYMAYYGYSSVGSQDGVAFTTDAAFPLGWAKHPQNPILKVSASPSFDDESAGKPFILSTPGAIYHYYTAVGTTQTTASQRSIALAIDAPIQNVQSRITVPVIPIVDNFTRADSTTTLGNAATGQPWTNLGAGIWRTVGNTAGPHAVAASNEAVVTIPAGTADGHTYCKISTPAAAGTSLGIIFRMLDGSHFVWADCDPSGIGVTKRNGGTDTVIAAKVSGAIAAGDTVEIYAYGSAITVMHNGSTIISITDPYLTGTGVNRGLRSYAGTDGQMAVDDFKATQF